MKKLFENLTEIEKFDLVKTYIENKQNLKSNDIFTICSYLGISTASVAGLIYSDKFFISALAFIPVFAFLTYEKIKLDKKFKKVTNNKLGYIKVNNSKLTKEFKELVANYNPEKRQEKNQQILDTLEKMNNILKFDKQQSNIIVEKDPIEEQVVEQENNNSHKPRMNIIEKVVEKEEIEQESQEKK